ncbi:MAG TPA: hypothetical protein VEI07_11045 [Planctomycetaceae bacterium]|nr:hypothetical protein [Planctomycetaceae bacterium]
MHGIGRSLAIMLLPVVLLSLVSGCTQSSGEFHSFQPAKKPAEGETVAADSKQTTTSPATPIATASRSEPKVDPKTPPSEAKLGSTASTITGSTSPNGAQVATSTSKNPASAPAAATPSASAPAAAKGPQTAASSAPRKVQLLVPNKTFRSEGEALRVSYDDIDLLKVLNMDPVPADAANYMPAWLKALDGRRIRIRGFMYPTFQQTGVHAFGLARDNQICCFGRNPKIYDVFDVVLHEGSTTNYIPNRPFDVVGVFHIRPEAEDGKLYRLYEMDDAAVMTR